MRVRLLAALLAAALLAGCSGRAGGASEDDVKKGIDAMNQPPPVGGTPAPAPATTGQ